MLSRDWRAEGGSSQTDRKDYILTRTNYQETPALHYPSTRKGYK